MSDRDGHKICSELFGLLKTSFVTRAKELFVKRGGNVQAIKGINLGKLPGNWHLLVTALNEWYLAEADMLDTFNAESSPVIAGTLAEVIEATNLDDVLCLIRKFFYEDRNKALVQLQQTERTLGRLDYVEEHYIQGKHTDDGNATNPGTSIFDQVDNILNNR